MEGKGEMIDVPIKKYNYGYYECDGFPHYCDHFWSAKQQSSALEKSPEINTLSWNLAEEIREKLESHSKTMKNKRMLKRGESFDISGDSVSPLNSIHVNTKSGSFALEDPWERRRPEISKIQQQRSSSREDCKKTSSRRKEREKETTMKQPGEKHKKETNRKKILKRSSKVEIETPVENVETNFEKRLSSNISNQEVDKSKVMTNNSVRKTKPILKRSENFEVSMDKNSILRKSDSVKKVLHKDANLKGKLLQLQPFNDISFDSSFKPVHVKR